MAHVEFGTRFLTPSTYPSQDLLSLDAFSQDYDRLNEREQLQLSYQRARVISQTQTLEDILYLKPKFWLLYRDMIWTKDSAAATLVFIQYNLAAGTLAPFVLDRPDLVPLMKSILEFKTSAQYLLTEVGHGLDARNLETTATLLANGEFDLHSPTKDSAKYMPMTTPQEGFEREIADGLVRLIPKRAGSKIAGHSITTFDHVRLPSLALLGTLSKAPNLRTSFTAGIGRVGIGTLALATLNIPFLKMAAYIAGTYSFRRTVGGSDGRRSSIIHFRTQHVSIMHALAESAIFEAYADEAINKFVAEKNPAVQHALGACFKAAIGTATQTRLFQLSERCGAQGLFKHNQIIGLQLEARGINIAEGDILVLCIRLASELLIGRYEMPKPRDPSCLLARYEAGLFKEAQGLLKEIGGKHRSDEFNRLVLPLCQPLIEAIGCRMAYEAAVTANCHADLITLYEAGVMMRDRSWFVENLGMKRVAILRKEDRCIKKLMPHLKQLLEQTGAAPYVTAPIVSEDKWDGFVDQMETHIGPNTISQEDIHKNRLAMGGSKI
ncbi:Acyl-coenzyme A oxidase-like protein [Lachnellula subtilissima]|uniref:Acyl-coenzyme A oxidase-like protein n=1 Tax=Lachnellula subtilissima TaxID=602034 RepID=A0A8H8RFZ3_9HELO|nr:Acyl-coenzyme A oxidase-like protein [Lachnellula subtilissima]